MVHLAMPEKREIVLLLGAGATVDAGLPMAIGLTNCAEEGIADKYPTLLPVLRFISGAIQFGKACQGEPLTYKINIEELLTACSFLASREKSDVYPFVAAWHELINTLQLLPEEIQSDGTVYSFQFLADYCKQGLRDWLEIRYPAKLKYLWGFRDFINAGYKLRIFTLNYDECIERALADALGDININWTTGFGERGWDPKLLGSDEYEAYVYKLHGSLDWVRDPKLGICSVKWPPARESEELPADFEALLVFGTDVKLQAVDPFLTLLFRFQQLLNASDVLVVVGYSFGDHHINAMILEALQRDPRMRCIIANPKSLDELLPHDSDFQRLVAVEQRFVEVRLSAKEAFDSNELLNAVDGIFKAHEEELPF
jgi:NAD-dependent SIR2 family protein deacetylase